MSAGVLGRLSHHNFKNFDVKQPLTIVFFMFFSFVLALLSGGSMAWADDTAVLTSRPVKVAEITDGAKAPNSADTPKIAATTTPNTPIAPKSEAVINI